MELNLIIYDQVGEPKKANWKIRDFNRNNWKRHLTLMIDNEKMYVSGSRFNDTLGDNSCYLPIFRHNLDKQKVIIGNILMSKYYTIFDMSRLKDQNYMSIGFGNKNTNDLIKKGVTNSA